MPRRTFDFDEPDRFIAGAVGQPGQRAFFLQARKGRRTISVALEKIQVAALADRLGRLILELEANERIPAAAGATADAVLEVPLEAEFRVGTIAFGWDGEHSAFLVEARAVTEEDEEADDEPVGLAGLEAVIEEAADDEDEDDDDDPDDPDGPDILRVRLTATAARAFVEHAHRVVAAGRPPCPICGNPLDPGGHICPRRNGSYVN